MFDLPQLERAQEVVAAAMPPTPAHAWPLLARAARRRRRGQAREPHADRRLQGARRAGLCRPPEARAAADLTGIISATTGNHGQSLAFAAGRYNLPVTIYVPHGNSVEKNRAMRAFGATLIEHGQDFEAARDEAEASRRDAGLKDDSLRSIAILCLGSFDLRARTVSRSGSGSRRALRADRSGLGHFRLHHGARSAGA